MLSKKIKKHTHELNFSITKELINLDRQTIEEIEPILWRSICSEYDSINFYTFIKNLGITYTNEFEQFVVEWLHDEIEHTVGFKKLYQTIYDIKENQIDFALKKRKADFSNLLEFFGEEVSICLLLAFDEIVTAHVYERSIPFYSKINSSVLPKWIKKIKIDEVNHFYNVTNLLKNTHKVQIKTAEKILHRIIEVDTNLSDYYGTFVLDHACPEFPLSKKELINICVKAVLKRLH